MSIRSNLCIGNDIVVILILYYIRRDKQEISHTDEISTMFRFAEKDTHALLEKNPYVNYNAFQKKKPYFNDSNPSFLIPTIKCLDVPIKCTEALMIGFILYSRRDVVFENHS